MGKYALALSLGHNSSAVAIVDGEIICGYEEERFSGIKSDPSYPINSIEACKRVAELPDDTEIYISHWFLDGVVQDKTKYYDKDDIHSKFPKTKIYAVDTEFTHHDAHAYSAEVFLKQDPPFEKDYYSIVMDGFGTYGECMSVYKKEFGELKVIDRYFGFDNSIGMFYQYATAYMGMKMHNHEYKILAYETHIYDTDELTKLEPAIQALSIEYAALWLTKLQARKISNHYDPLISLNALPKLQLKISKDLDDVLLSLGYPNIELDKKRIIISRFVQSVTEKVILGVVGWYNAENLVLSGGVFLNVKVNNLITKIIPGKVCVMPLAGDQGASLGVYEYINNDLKWPGHLFWGVRDLGLNASLGGDIIYAHSMDEAMPKIISALSENGFVNVIRGNMEYGPRALCNTSTLAVANKQVAYKINLMNDRTNEMPMAPVISKKLYDQYFNDTSKVYKSDEYMVIALDYKVDKVDSVLGAAHYYNDYDIYTGRPQVTSDPHISKLIDIFGPLINTSFNYHGHPIVFNGDQVINTHLSQCKKLRENIVTIIIRN